MTVRSYLLRRTGTALLSVLGIAVVVFAVTQILPGDPARLRAGPYATVDQIARIRAQFGLDQPILVQLTDYLFGLGRLDLGNATRTGQPVLEELLHRLPATLELSVTALIIALLLGIGLGILGGAKKGGLTDSGVRIFALFASSTAPFWVGLMAIYFFCNVLGWFPSPIGRLPRGFIAPTGFTGFYTIDALANGDLALAGTALRSLLLPALVLGVLTAPAILKVTRSSMARALESPYVRTAQSFGISRSSILIHDGFRNTLVPVLTSVGIVAGYLIGGNIIVEQLFAWPGIGQYAYQALQENDFNALRGYVLFVGVEYVILNFILDLLYAAADPRIKLGAAK